MNKKVKTKVKTKVKKLPDMPVDPYANYLGLNTEDWLALHRGEAVEIEMNPHIEPFVETVKKEVKDGDSK